MGGIWRNKSYLDDHGHPVKGAVYELYNSKDEKLTVTDWDSLDTDNIWNKIIWKKDNTIDDLQNIVAEKGDIYIWICELDSDFNPKIVVEAKKIERLEQLPLGKRIVGHFFDDDTTIISREPTGNEDRKVNVKVGKVTDKSLLQALKNKEANSLQKLLTYAKSADAVYNDKLPLGDSRETIFSSANIVSNEYYYVYMELDDKNGTYYPVEDVSLYQSYGSGLYDYLDNGFTWNLEDETTTPDEENKKPTQQEEDQDKNTVQKNEKVDNTIAQGTLPQTGLYNIILITTLTLITFIVFIGIKLKKYKGV